MLIKGKVVEVIPRERIIKVKSRKQIHYIYMSRKFFKDFSYYLYQYPFVFVQAEKEKTKYGFYSAHEVIAIEKIFIATFSGKIVYFDIDLIKQGVIDLLENNVYKLFLDLEFSLPSYYQSKAHTPEIVQYGMILEDPKGDVILEDKNLVLPKSNFSLNLRTLKFLNKSREDFKDAVQYIELYQTIERLIDEYDIKIIAWGRNDIITLEQSFKINRLKPLNIKERYINLMQVVKNYYNQRVDLGLFNTYEEFSGIEQEGQSHDAFEDALMAREIYRIFKNQIMKENGK